MEKIKEMLTDKMASLKAVIANDKARYGDPFLCQHMRGRVAVEEHWLEFCQDLLDLVERL